MPVRGQSCTARGCSGNVTLVRARALRSYLCSRDAKPTDLRRDRGAGAEGEEDGERLPFHYVMVLVKEGDKVPLWGNFDALKRATAVNERQLEHGDAIADRAHAQLRR